MDIFIFRDGQQYGPYPEADCRSYVLDGQLQQNDLAWHEGMSDWKPLSDVLSDLEKNVEIYLLQDGEQTGPFQRDILKASVESGQIAGDSWAWHEGLGEWTPLEVLLADAASPAQTTAVQAGEKKETVISPKDQKVTMRIPFPSLSASKKFITKTKL